MYLFFFQLKCIVRDSYVTLHRDLFRLMVYEKTYTWENGPEPDIFLQLI